MYGIKYYKTMIRRKLRYICCDIVIATITGDYDAIVSNVNAVLHYCNIYSLNVYTILCCVVYCVIYYIILYIDIFIKKYQMMTQK